MKIFQYDYETYIELREKIQLTRAPMEEYIYIVKFTGLHFVSIRDISVYELKQYDYVGKVLGQPLYVEQRPLIEDRVSQAGSITLSSSARNYPLAR